ncbi:hypothetical protein FRC12_023688, partial [Ceratobasidium sp. 428]
MIPLPSEAACFKSARQAWEDAGAGLRVAISDYLKAVSDINNISGQAGSASDRKALVSRIDDHLSNFDMLLDSRVQLKRLRNRHEALTNSLPVEILTHVLHIFANWTQPILLYGNELPDVYQRTTTLASVCHHWRHIMLESHTLWSMVPFIGEDCYRDNSPLARLWLERSSNAALHIVISHQRTQPITISPMLMPHAARFRTLSIVADTLENIHAMILCWFDHGAAGSVTELSVSIWNGYVPLLPPNVHNKHPREVIDNFLRPIN